MRFKKGSKVEVMNKKDSPVSWCPAEIVSGNGHTYSVRYDYYLSAESKARGERVSRRDIRPCPPPSEGVENGQRGQIIEVFGDCSWRTAIIVKVLDRDYYLVHPTGCSQEIRVHRSNTRGSGTYAKPDQLPTQKPSKKVSVVLSARNGFHVRDGDLAAQRSFKRQKYNASSLVSLKRVSDESSRNIQVVVADDRDFKRRKIVPAALEGKTHDIARWKGNRIDEKYVSASFNNWSDGYFGLNPTKRRGINDYYPARIGESNDSDSDACSIGSCSINRDSPNKISSFSAEVHCQVPDLLCSDAESFQSSAEQHEEESCHLSSKQNVAANIRELELHAYRCTLEALYASGPLSWEQEALLTNLRIALHISNDEHLTELRTLISSGTGRHLDACILCLLKSKDDACICSTSPGHREDSCNVYLR
ncbi:putative pleiotropic drug resistance protein 2-like [Capsicum annuum]|nr:putative pleiotropic drug resistance protein 2-like [Capsicum annuum]